MVARAGEAAKIGFHVHPHMLRHSCGFALANKGTRHASTTGVVRASQHPAHRPLHRIVARTLQGLLAAVAVDEESGILGHYSARIVLQIFAVTKRGWFMKRAMAFLLQFCRKFLHEGLPIALAGGIGTLAFSHFAAPMHQEPPAAVKKAKEEMLQLMREEHALIINFLKRDSETRQIPTGDAAQEKAQLPSGDLNEDVPKSRPPSRTTRHSAKKSVHQNSVVADPLPITPNVSDTASAGTVSSKPGLLSQLWFGTGRWFGDLTSSASLAVPMPPLPVRF